LLLQGDAKEGLGKAEAKGDNLKHDANRAVDKAADNLKQ
jgi:hypothetical protein